jgi:hypothetical protein
MKKSGTKTPHIELEEIGPAADLVIRITQLASSDLFKTACRTPAAAKVFFFFFITRPKFALIYVINHFLSIAQEGEEHVQRCFWHKDGSHSYAKTGLQQVTSKERTSSTSREENQVQQEIFHLKNLLFQYSEKGTRQDKWNF